MIKISEVLTTANSEDESANVIPVGNMAGHGKVFSSLVNGGISVMSME